MTNTYETYHSLPIIAFVGSPLQYASFVASRHFKRTRLLVGHRGMPGDVSFSHAILNDWKFIAKLDGVIGNADVEVFLPNSINSLFLACAAHPRVKRISYLDEGHLLTRHLEAHYKRRKNPFTRILVVAHCISTMFSGAARRLLIKALVTLHNITFSKWWTNNVERYRYQVIDMRFKGGVVLSHLDLETPVPKVEFVNILPTLHGRTIYSDMYCVLLHPNSLPDHNSITKLVEKLMFLHRDNHSILLRPHPLFSMHQEKLNDLCALLDRQNINWQLAELSNKQDTAVELYALGVRNFVLTGDTTISRTVEDHPNYFRDLKIARI